jgi:hypothetical protein
LDIDKLDLLHKILLVYGPKIDRDMFKKFLMAVTLLADRDTGDELKRILQQL